MRLIKDLGLVIERDALGDQNVWTYEGYMIGLPGLALFMALRKYAGLQEYVQKHSAPRYTALYDTRPYMPGHPENGWI